MLIIDVSLPNGTLSFSYQKRGESTPLFLGTVAEKIKGQFRAIALLGYTNQSLSFAEVDSMPPWIPARSEPMHKQSRALQNIMSALGK